MHRLLERLDRRPAHALVEGRGDDAAERPGDGAAATRRRSPSGPRSPTRARRSSPGSSTSTTVRWAYEPDTFPIGWNLDGDVVESFSPDFYLPDLDLYVELTTLKQKLVRKKNRKLRRLRELYPDIRIKLFYARDFRMLLLKFGRLALLDELTGTTGQSTPPRAYRRRRVDARRGAGDRRRRRRRRRRTPSAETAASRRRRRGPRPPSRRRGRRRPAHAAVRGRRRGRRRPDGAARVTTAPASAAPPEAR